MLPDVVAEAARRYGQAPAIVDADEMPISYHDLHERSLHVAAGLVDRGVGPGDVVALRLPSGPAYVLAYLGAASIGAVTAGVNPRLASVEQDALVTVAAPAVTLVSPDDVDVLEDRGRLAPSVEPIESRPGTDVAIVFTSGTTGLPKGAVFTNRQLGAITEIDVQGRWGGGGPMIAATQFAHVGFMTKLAWYLRLGSTIHLLHRWRSADVLRLTSEHRMASIGGVAPQIALLVRDPLSRHLDFSSVKTIVVGGGPSPPALVAEARERFDAAYSIRYSSTESGGCGTGTAFDADDTEALHTIGRPRPGVEVSIRDPDGAELATGEIGEICLRSDAVMDRYWNDPAATADTLRLGWLWSGDLGYVDDRGLLRLAGRRKEMYIRGGYNVYPVEVEAALADHPGVAAVAVIGVAHDVLGETGHAVVVPTDASAPPSLDDLCRHLRDRVATYKLPESLRIVGALPLTAMDKIDRRALQAGVDR